MDPRSERMFFVLHRYYPAPGGADALLAVRLRTSAAMRTLGMTGGQVGVRRYGEYPPSAPPSSGPDVLHVWTSATIAAL